MSEEVYNIVRLVVWAIGVPIIIALLISIIRRTRAITRRIAEVREEASRTPTDPYAQMAALYEQKEAIEKLNRAKRGKV